MAFDAGYTEYQRNRSALRKWVRGAYLRSAQAQLHGRTLDFGCGVGELLSRLPAGSRGLEYNPATVDYCRSLGLAVDAYDGFADDWSLSLFGTHQQFDSMLISHVLEHLQQPADILHKLLNAARRLGVQDLLVIVPGQAGYRIDDTHQTFVDRAMLVAPQVREGTGFELATARYFPGNVRAWGDWFPHHELQVRYTRTLAG